MAKVKGIVTSIRELSSSNCIYWIILPGIGRTIRIRSPTRLGLMDAVELEIIDAEDDKTCDVESIGTVSQSEYVSARDSMLSSLGIHKPTIPDIGPAGNAMATALIEQIMDAASRIGRNIVSGAPISVHFHSDGDGSTGAIGLSRGFKAVAHKISSEHKAIKWDAVRGVAYTEESFYSDEMFFKSFLSVERPMAIMTDFGTTPESNASSGKLAGISDIIWIDHHPIDKGFERPPAYYINPWDHHGDSSLTAGFITCMLASSFGENLEEMMLVSLLSDHSSLAKADKDKEEIAAVLDAINIHNPDGLPTTPQYMESVLSDKTKFSYVLSESREQMSAAISIGLKKGRTLKSSKGFLIFVLDFEKIAKMRFNYIKMGKYTSELHSAIEKGQEPAVTVVYHKRYISARASHRVASTSILLDTVRKMSEDKEEVENGGGHNEAASMRLVGSDAEQVTKKFVSYLGGAF
jgi:Archaea-specific RecJ-like exonuclease, contains DnaJ-type Zn finger domain